MMKPLLEALVFLCLSAFTAVAQVQPNLAVRLSAEQSSYTLHDHVQLVIVRENRGDHNIAVPKELGWGIGRTNIRVFDAKGNEVRTPFLADELPPPPRPYDFLLLGPAGFAGTHVREAVTDLVNEPGEYELMVEYTSYLSEHYAREALKLPPDAPFWSQECGTITSNRIKLRITR